MYIILEACKLADPARDSRGNVNLSVEFFLNHADFSNDPAGFDKLNNRATKIREFGKKLKPARDKIISHLDRPTAVSDIAGLGAADTAEWNEFWLDVDAFVQLLCMHHFAQVNHGLLFAAHSDVGRVVTTLRENGRGLANMTKKDQTLITSLGRISKYLPNTSLDPLSRVKIDDKGRLWVEEDTILIVLRGHLIIEHELVDICDRFLQQPDALPDRTQFRYALTRRSCRSRRRRVPKSRLRYFERPKSHSEQTRSYS